MKKQKSFKGVSVEVRNDNVDMALKIFKRKVKDSKILVEYKDRQEFEKKSDKLRRKRKVGRNRAKKIQLEKVPLF